MAIVHVAAQCKLYGGGGSPHGFLTTGTWLEENHDLPWWKGLGKITMSLDVGYDNQSRPDGSPPRTDSERFTIRRIALYPWCPGTEWDVRVIVERAKQWWRTPS